VNRKVIFLNVVLLALAGWLCWTLRMKWRELHQHEHTVLALSPPARRVLNPPPPPMFKPMQAAEYNDPVVQKVVFFKDRNPNVIVDPPPPPPPTPPPPPMPDLPAYYGTMALFGDPVVLLSLPKGAQKKYHAGDKVGPFVLVSFDREKVVFDWNGKMVERKPEELKEKEGAAAQVAQAADAAPMRVEPVKLYSAEPPPDAPKISPKIGADNGGGIHQCVAGDTTPPGTVVDGYKKVVTMNMFGQTCMWMQVNQ
jgi:hypothetical protein